MTTAGPDLVLRPLDERTLPDLLHFFEGPAFADHPAWRSCYCHFPHADHATIRWADRTAAQNRSATCERVREGRMHGWLAYAGDDVVGWCNAGPRELIAGLFDDPEPLADRIGAIACFVVAPDHRGQGLATTLLRRACERLAEQGFEWAEAYPREAAEGAGANHHGPLAMYRRAGFEVVRREADGALTVRKRIAV
jgi:ribosomal protein S18 acetylase RimI-like enzyme